MDETPGAVDVLDRTTEWSTSDRPRRRLNKQQWLAVGGLAVAALIVVAIALGGTGSGSSGSSGGGGSFAGGTTSNGASADVRGGLPAVASPKIATGSAGGAGSAGAATSGGPLAQGAVKVPSSVPTEPGTKVVKTGEMDLQVDKGQVGHTLDRLTAIATLEHGFVADTHSDEGADASGAMTLRVPVRAFEDTLSQVRKLDAKVLSVQVSGQDVTAQYVDLNARLKALNDTRATFEKLLGRAATIGETLEVQAHITDVQTQIEQLQGQINVLDDQSSNATLTVTVDQGVRPVATVTHHRNGMSAAVDRSVTRFVNGIEAIVGILGPVLLVVLIVAVLAVGGRWGYRLVRRQLA